MTEPIRKDESAGGHDRATANANSTVIYGERRRRSMGWRTKDVLRTAALVIAMYVGVRMIWFASPLFLTAFLGILFGLAVSVGVDHLARWRIPRGLGAALMVITFLGLLVGFGAWVAPTIRAQSVELRHRLPEAIDRRE
jgi:predicted PurR-regulated permease PerM